MSNYLINTDSSLSGIFRVIIIYKVGDEKSRVYIPGQVVNPLNSDGTLNEAVFEKNKLVYPLAIWNSKPMRDLIPEDKVIPGWIVYESGDIKMPVIMGYLGKGLDMADEWSIEVVGGNSSTEISEDMGVIIDDGSGGVVTGTGGIIDTAMKYLGVPYVWGGTTPSGFDCSGFVQYVYAQHGINITRTTYTQWDNDGARVSIDKLQPGDLIYFGSTLSPHHVGMYVGNGQFIHAPRTGEVIKISNLSDRSDIAGAKRIL